MILLECVTCRHPEHFHYSNESPGQHCSACQCPRYVAPSVREAVTTSTASESITSGSPHPPESMDMESDEDSAVEAMLTYYINSLSWSEGTPDIARTLVAGNIRGFYGWLQREGVVRSRDNSEEIVRLYHELLNEVEHKQPGGSRHQTALRILRERRIGAATVGASRNA